MPPLPVLGLVLATIFAGVTTSWAQNELKVYGYTHASADQIQSGIQMLLKGQGERVTMYPAQQQAAVLARPEVQQVVQQFITQFDQPVPNVQIQVRFGQRSRSRSSAVEGDWSIRSNRRLGLPPQIRGRPTLSSQSGTADQLAVQTLVVASGHSASIEVGERVPYLDWLTTYADTQGWFDDELDFKWDRVGAYLAVQVRVVGQGPKALVHVTLIPELRGLVQGRRHQVRFQRVSTSVVTYSGQTLTIGGLAGHQEFYQRFLGTPTGISKTTERTSGSITLTPTVLARPGQAAPSASGALTRPRNQGPREFDFSVKKRADEKPFLKEPDSKRAPKRFSWE